MERQINTMANEQYSKGILKVFSLMALTFSLLTATQAQADSTFFPEDENLTESKTDATNSPSDAIKEWAELTPPKQKSVDLSASHKEEVKEITLAKPQTSAPEKPELQQQLTPRLVLEPTVEESHPTEKKPAELGASNKEQVKEITVTESHIPTLEKPELPQQQPMPKVALESTAKESLPTEEQKPLQVTAVQPHPKALPIHETTAPGAPTTQKTVPYSDAANDRVPLGILEPNQEIHNQRWYIYSSAIRGIKNPTDNVHIVSMEGSAPNRGADIKTLLVEMGIEPEKIQIIHAKGEQNQAGFVYIFAGK